MRCGMNRPRLDNKKSHTVKVRMADEEVQELSGYAHETGMTMSDVIRLSLKHFMKEKDISCAQPMLPGMEFLKREFKPDGKLDYVWPMTTDEYFDYLREKDELTPSEQAVFETMWSSKNFRMNHKTGQ